MNLPLRYYDDLGWCIIAVPNGTKQATIKWSQYQKLRPERHWIENWFCGDRHGPAVIFGAVSGNLGCRDFDDPEAYEIWAKEHSDLAVSLPTVSTHAGRKHVYFTLSTDAASLKATLGKAGNGAIAYEDGELRFDSGCYCILPPAQHPSGEFYKWLIDPFSGIPTVDPIEAGLAGPIMTQRPQAPQQSQRTQRPQTPQRTQEDADYSGKGVLAVDAVCPESAVCPELSVFSVSHPEIRKRIDRNIPTIGGTRNRMKFELLRDLHAIPDFRGTSWKDVQDVMYPIIADWYGHSEGVVTDSLEATFVECASAWEKVKVPKGEGVLEIAYQQSLNVELPPLNPKLPLSEKLMPLVRLCFALQQHHGQNPFFLSCRDAAEFGNTNHNTAASWLTYLCMAEVLKLETPGSLIGRKSTEYRFIGGHQHE